MPPPKQLRSNSISGDKDEDGATEQLINKVCLKFVNQIESKIDTKFANLEDQLRDVSNSLKIISNLANTNQNAIVELNDKVAFLEQQSKRNALRFHGFSVQQNENVPEMIRLYIKDNMKVSCAINDIDYAFRLGKSTDPAKPSVVMVNFTSNIKRNEVFAAKKLSKNSGVAIFEDLTKERHKLLIAAKNKYGKTQAWTSGGRVYVSQGNNKCIINSVKDL